MTDPHHVLGVPVNATPAEITSAYHRLVRLHHPDTAAGTAEPDRFREVVAAYTMLRDHTASAEPAPRHETWFTTPAIRVGPVRYHGPAR